MVAPLDWLWGGLESSYLSQKRRLRGCHGARLLFSENRGNGHLEVNSKFQHILRNTSSLLSDVPAVVTWLTSFWLFLPASGPHLILGRLRAFSLLLCSRYVTSGISFNPQCQHYERATIIIPILQMKTGAQRDELICLRLSNWHLEELGFTSRPYVKRQTEPTDKYYSYLVVERQSSSFSLGLSSSLPIKNLGSPLYLVASGRDKLLHKSCQRANHVFPAPERKWVACMSHSPLCYKPHVGRFISQWKLWLPFDTSARKLWSLENFHC